MLRAALLMIVGLVCCVDPAGADDRWVVYDGFPGPGKGKHIVLVSGDEEYRSEEAMPQLGQILAKHHGFRCTVLFALDDDGTINPDRNDNIPGLEALATADLMVIFTRFRNLPDDQMRHIAAYVDAGKPILGLRTATHAFNLRGETSYLSYSWNDKSTDGGFGRRVLGETWQSHHGAHGKQSTRGIVAPGVAGHPILRGIKDGDVWGPSDVYGVRLPLPAGSQPLLLGQVLEGMNFDDPPLAGPKNDPMMPVAWTKHYTGVGDKQGRVFTTTLGASTDLVAEGTRRLVVNAAYWCVGLEEQIPERSRVEIVGTYEPSPFKFKGAKRGVKPADHAW